MADKVYDKFKDDLAKALLDWTSGAITVTVLLVDSTSTYVPSDAHNFLSDFTGNGGVELSTTNYARKPATSRAVTRDDATLHGEKLTAANITWTALGPASAGPTIKAVLIFKDTGTATTSDLIAYLDSGGNKTVNGGDLTLQWAANGVMTLT